MAHQPVVIHKQLLRLRHQQWFKFTVQSDTVRVVPTDKMFMWNRHNAVTTSDYYVPSGTLATLNLGRLVQWESLDITKGASTVITLSEGMGNPFKVDDVLTISGVTGVTGFNTTAKVISSRSRTIGFAQFGAKLTVDHDSRLNSDNAVTTAAEQEEL